MNDRVKAGERQARGLPGRSLPERTRGRLRERVGSSEKSGGAAGAGAARSARAALRSGLLGSLLGGLGLLAFAGFARAASHADGSSGSAVRRGSRTEVDAGGVTPGHRAIGVEINVYGWGRPDPNAGTKAQDDGDWLEVKGGGGEVWSKGHVFDADHRSGASTLRGGVRSSAKVEIRVTVPPGCRATGTCSDAITMPWDYTVSGDGIHVLRCTGTGVDIKGEPHSFTLDPTDLSSAHLVTGKADQGASQRGSSKGTAGLPSLLKIEAHDEGTVTSSSSVEYKVTSSSAKAKSGVVVIAKVTDTKDVEGGVCGWEYSSRVLDTLSAQALVSRADTSLGRFDVLHAIETSWSIVHPSDPTKSHGPHDLGSLPRTLLAPSDAPHVGLPTDGSGSGDGSTGSGTGTSGSPREDGATGKIVAPRGLASEAGATPGLLLLETDRSGGPTLTWELAATPEGRVALPSTLVVHAGDPSGVVTLSALEAGPFTVCATLCDALGLPTETRLLLTGESLALASLGSAEPTVRVEGWHLDPASGRWLALAGSVGGGLTLERSGSSGPSDAATTFELEVVDPTGVLRGLPTTATIAAGDTCTRLPLDPCGVEGDAEVVVRCGSFSERVTVRSVRQAIACPLAGPHLGATVPVGGRAVLPLTLAVPEDAPRVAELTALDTTVASVPTDASVIHFAAGADRAWAAFEARGVGTATLRASTPGAPDLDLPVTVVPTEVEMTRADVTLSGLGEAASGVLRLRLPAGVTWRGAIGDPTRGVEVVGGTGTGTLVVEVAPDPDRDRPTVLSVTLDGAPEEAFEVAVDDRVHGERSLYRVAVP